MNNTTELLRIFKSIPIGCPLIIEVGHYFFTLNCRINSQCGFQLGNYTNTILKDTLNRPKHQSALLEHNIKIANLCQINDELLKLKSLKHLKEINNKILYVDANQNIYTHPKSKRIISLLNDMNKGIKDSAWVKISE